MQISSYIQLSVNSKRAHWVGQDYILIVSGTGLIAQRGIATGWSPDWQKGLQPDQPALVSPKQMIERRCSVISIV